MQTFMQTGFSFNQSTLRKRYFDDCSEKNGQFRKKKGAHFWSECLICICKLAQKHNLIDPLLKFDISTTIAQRHSILTCINLLQATINLDYMEKKFSQLHNIINNSDLIILKILV